MPFYDSKSQGKNHVFYCLEIKEYLSYLPSAFQLRAKVELEKGRRKLCNVTTTIVWRIIWRLECDNESFTKLNFTVAVLLPTIILTAAHCFLLIVYRSPLVFKSVCKYVCIANLNNNHMLSKCTSNENILQKYVQKRKKISEEIQILTSFVEYSWY